MEGYALPIDFTEPDLAPIPAFSRAESVQTGKSLFALGGFATNRDMRTGCKLWFAVGMPAQVRRGTCAQAELQGHGAVQGDGRYLDWSQSGCILPVLAHCCAQTNQLWILSKGQAECLPAHFPHWEVTSCCKKQSI